MTISIPLPIGKGDSRLIIFQKRGQKIKKQSAWAGQDMVEKTKFVLGQWMKSPCFKRKAHTTLFGSMGSSIKWKKESPLTPEWVRDR